MMTKDIELRNKKFNLGIELLRFVLCVWVVIIHCSNIKKKDEKYFGRGFHVPTFILISFYFYYPLIEKRKIIKILFRFQRLLYPYILWPIIIFILNNFVSVNIPKEQINRKLNINDFYVQVLIGTRYHVLFWFLFNLLFLSVFITIIAFIFKKKFLVVMKLLGTFCLYIHFSGINVKLFFLFHRYFRIPLGSLAELMPLAVIGSIFSSNNLLLKLNNPPFHLYLIYIFLIYLLFEYNLFIYYKGCIYPNILLNITASSILFISFGTLNYNRLIMVNSIIKYITKYTGGIYYIHPIIRNYLRKYFIFFQNKSYFSSFIIYIINYFICFIGSKTFQNNKIKYLFI